MNITIKVVLLLASGGNSFGRCTRGITMIENLLVLCPTTVQLTFSEGHNKVEHCAGINKLSSCYLER